MEKFPHDFSNNVTGFGGDVTLNKTRHRAAIKKTPVILVHGNGANSAHPKWGWQTMVKFLKAYGYQDCEIWAMDYLGEDNDDAELPNPHTNHIDEFRTFVDLVRDYLHVERVDFISHSLGCGMVNGYLRGLQADGTWDDEKHRFDSAGTSVSLAGGTCGLGSGSIGEFQTGSAFEIRSHIYNDIVDDTPSGSDDLSEQIAPVASWKKVTPLDDQEVYYVAVIAAGDFVDVQHPDTSRREGAHLNLRINLGYGLAGHEKIIKDQAVFDAFKGYLNKYPPAPPVSVQLDKASGSYGSSLQLTVGVQPANIPVDYKAERLTRAFEAGYIIKHVAETHSGTLTNGQVITLAPDGAWEVTCSAAGAEPVAYTYGVNVKLPEVAILTENDEKFKGSLVVVASTTKGVLYSSLDAKHWSKGANVTITDNATVYFMAIDANGIPSVMASRAYEEIVYPQVTASLTEHFIAGRLKLNDYLALGQELGFMAVITLYQIDGEWVYNPKAPQHTVSALINHLAMARRIHSMQVRQVQPVINADTPSGDYTNSFDVNISASDAQGNPVTVYYTEDGSDPSDGGNANRHRFVGSQRLKISGEGHHALFCYAQDSSGNEVFVPFAWNIQ